MVNFTFKGKYTLREINGVWYVYDRDLNAIIEGNNTKPQNTFIKARNQLIGFKKLIGEEV
jgi:hypothetical protein